MTGLVLPIGKVGYDQIGSHFFAMKWDTYHIDNIIDISFQSLHSLIFIQYNDVTHNYLSRDFSRNKCTDCYYWLIVCINMSRCYWYYTHSLVGLVLKDRVSIVYIFMLSYFPITYISAGLYIRS